MIEITELSKTFNNKVNAVRDFSLSVEKGEVISLIGPSGSGKSTVLRCIAGLETPDAGTILIDGKQINYRNEKEAQKQRTIMGFVFQHFNLFANMTVLQNLTVAPINVQGKSETEARELAMKYLKRVGLEDKADEFPSKLSGGQQQRVAIARALVTRPSLLLADEPTGNLDSHTSREIMDMFCELHEQGNTIVLITHDSDVAKQAKRIIRILDGRLTEVTL